MSDYPNIAPQRETYDAIVVGSGITGGWAAKELTEQGLSTLVLERGPYIEHGEDYDTEHTPSWEFRFQGQGDRQRYAEEYPIQSKCYAFGESTEKFFTNDKKNPYVQEEPFTWIRGYQLGGRSLTWGRQCYRWSDLDFTANARDGFGVDWPIRYADIAPWYDYVEEHVGISGREEGLPHLPDGQFLPPMEMNVAEQQVKVGIESAYEDRMMTMGRVAVLTKQHKGRQACHYCGPCYRG
jgi:choline dehydrogenase-like flavoprotein